MRSRLERSILAAMVLAAASAPCLLTVCSPASPSDAGIGSGDSRIEAAVEGGLDRVMDAGCVHPQVEASCANGFCRIPPGCFFGGSPESEWGRGKYTETRMAIWLSHAFIIQEHELTQGEWMALGYPNRAGTTNVGGTTTWGDCVAPECPASNMTFYEALDYANKLSILDGRKPCYALSACEGDSSADGGIKCGKVEPTATSPYECEGWRLPTDAEWEYAARAGTTTAFYSGDITPYDVQGDCSADPSLEPIAWYCWNSGNITHPVKTKRSNAWGLFDMSGNALELVSDPDKGRDERPPLNPWQPVGEESATMRSGAAHVWASLARSASRLSAASWGLPPQLARGFALGFRLARTLGPSESSWGAPPLGPRDGGADQ